MSYYAANARENGGNCGAGHLADIGGHRVVSESGDPVVVAVNHTFSATHCRCPAALRSTSSA